MQDYYPIEGFEAQVGDPNLGFAYKDMAAAKLAYNTKLENRVKYVRIHCVSHAKRIMYNAFNG